MVRVLHAALVVLVLALALSLRLNLERPLTTDEASYALAGERGFLANWFDAPGVRKMRHEHPPLVVYLQQGSSALLGRTEAALRAPSVLLGVLTVAVVLLGFRRAAPELPAWTAVPAAALLAVFPPHVFASQWASWHAALALLFAATVLALVRALRTLNEGVFLTMWLGVAAAFAVMEYALVLLAAVLLTLAVRPNPWLRWDGLRLRTSRAFRQGLWLVPLVVGATWGAGVLKLSLPRNLLHYLSYREHPVLFRGSTTTDAPPWAYVEWYLEQMPAYLVLFALETVAVAALLAGRRWGPRHAAFPLVVLFGTLLAAVATQLVLDTVYTVYFGVAALLLLPFLITEAWRAAGHAGPGPRRAVAAGAAALTLTVALPTVPYAARVALPGTTGYRVAATAIARAAAECERAPRAGCDADPLVLSFYPRILEWYVPGLRVERWPLGPLPEERLAALRAGEYAWAVVHSAQVRRWPDDAALRWLRRHGRLAAHPADAWGELWLWDVDDAPAVAERAARRGSTPAEALTKAGDP